MNTPINSNDPRLLDLALGELDEAEALELSRQLQAPENVEALREMEALRATVRAASAALHGKREAAEEGLSDSRRNAVLEEASRRDTPWGRKRPVYRLLAAAALLLLCAGGAWLYQTLPDTRTQLAALRENEADERTYLLGEAEGRLLQMEDVKVLPEPTLSVSALPVDASKIETTAETVNEQPVAAPAQAPLHEEPTPQLTPAAPPPLPMPEPAPPMPDVHIQDVDARSRNTVSQTAVQALPNEAGRLFAEEAAETAAPASAPPPLEQSATAFRLEKDMASDGIVTSLGYFAPPMPPDKRYPGGESYAAIEERGFSNAADAPLSTFSLHSDGGAYANIRRFLEQGQLPPRDAVRIEELINYFSYDYPQPVGQHPFSVNIEVGPCPWAAGHLLAKVGLQAREAPRGERPPANLVFLIDVSGSMNRPNRLPLVKESLKALTETLEPSDRVGIVTYSGGSQVVLESTPVSQRDRIVAAIESLNAGGSTHGSAGIHDAYAMARNNMIDKGVNRVILATDGDFNVGVSSRDGLLALIEEKRRTGVFLTVLGYGMGNLKDANLELLASKGNGNYAYIDDYQEARRVLVEQVGGVLMTVAKDAKIQVEFNPAQVRSYRLLGYENRQLAARDFNDDAKDAGEIGAGHSATALYQIAPQGAPLDPGVDTLRYGASEQTPPPAPSGSTEMFFVKLRYKQPDSETSSLIEIPVPARAAALEQTTQDFRFAAAMAGFGLLLRDSAYKGEATFDQIRELAAAAVNSDHRREEALSLIVAAKTLRGSR